MKFNGNDIRNALFKELNVREDSEVPGALLETMLDTEKREKFLTAFSDNYSFGEIRLQNYFEDYFSNRKILKQDFTPSRVSKTVADMAMGRYFFKALDMCAGVGSLSIALSKRGIKFFRCEEVSINAIAFLMFNMAIRNLNCEIVQKDILTGEVFNCWNVTSGRRFSNIKKVDSFPEDEKFGCIVCNPPFSLSNDIPDDDPRFKDFGLPPKSRSEYAFIVDAINRLAISGKAYFILPEGALFRGGREGEIRRKLKRKNYIEGIVKLPQNMFRNTSIAVSLLCIDNLQHHSYIDENGNIRVDFGDLGVSLMCNEKTNLSGVEFYNDDFERVMKRLF